MAKNKYDIFISYRRKDAGDKAEHLYDLLETRYKGKISFDRENLTGLFDVALANRIDECKDFLLVLGKDSLIYNDDDFKPEQVELYRYLGSCSQAEFEQKIISLGPNANIDFVRIEIARALHRKDLNIIPIVPERTETYNFSQLNLPDDVVGIKRYEALFYSDHPDALFKDVIPKITPHLKAKPNKPLAKILYSLLGGLLLLSIAGAYWNHNHKIQVMRTQLEEKFSSHQLKLNTDLTMDQMRAIDGILSSMKAIDDTLYASQFEFTRGWWYGIWGKKVDAAEKDLPMTNLSFGDIQNVLIDLTDWTKISFALPSPEQWEYAARGGKNHETTLYVGSEDVNKVAWYKENSGGKAHWSNGQNELEPNGIDLYDMSGNVSEMCNISHDGNIYCYGGDYNSPASEVTVTSRKIIDGNAKGDAIGFRVFINKNISSSNY